MKLFDHLCPVTQDKTVCFYSPSSGECIDLVKSARKRPGMYVGSVGISGIYHMLFEILDFLILLSHRQQTLEISLEFSENWFAFRSNQLELKERSGWDTLGLPVAAALSQRFQIFLNKDGQRVCRSFEKGVFTEESMHPLLENQQIEIRVWPDPEIFTACKADYFCLYDRCYTLSALYPGASILLSGDGQYNRFCFPEGMGRLLSESGPQFLATEHLAPWTFECEINGVLLRGAIRKAWLPGKALSYANGYMTPQGGTHVEGMLQGIIRALKRSGKELPWGCDSDEDHVRGSYHLAIAVWLDNPSYAGSLKHKLMNKELVGIIADVIERMWRQQ